MSLPSEITRKTEHQEIWDLLPWFVNQSLNATEHAMVENHVKTCVTCRIELNQQQQVYKAMQQTDLMQQVSKASFKRLKKRIETKPVEIKPHREIEVEAEKTWGFIFPLSGTAKFAVFAVFLLLLIIPLGFHVPFEQPPALTGEYRTLAQSPSSSPVSVHHKSAVIRIIFNDKVEDDQISAIMDDLAMYRIEGPYANGIFEVHIANEAADLPSVTELLTQLRSNSGIFFAELAHEPFSSGQVLQ